MEDEFLRHDSISVVSKKKRNTNGSEYSRTSRTSRKSYASVAKTKKVEPVLKLINERPQVAKAITPYTSTDPEFITIAKRKEADEKEYNKYAGAFWKEHDTKYRTIVKGLGTAMDELELDLSRTENYEKALDVPVIPMTANNILRRTFHVSSFVNDNGLLRAGHTNAHKSVMLCGKTPTFYQSSDKYAQGLNIPTVAKSTEDIGRANVIRPVSGDLENTFILKLELQSYSNPFAHAIGFRLRYGGVDLRLNESGSFILPGADFLHESTGQQYHAILPPKSSRPLGTNGIVMFKSDSSINGKLAQEFPSLIPTRESIVSGITVNGDMARVPYTSAVARWLFKHKSEYGGWGNHVPYERLGPNREPLPVDQFEMAANDLNEVVNKVLDEAEKQIPVMDLRKISLEIEILDQTKWDARTLPECSHKEFETKNGTSLDPLFVDANISVMYMFREVYQENTEEAVARKVGMTTIDEDYGEDDVDSDESD